MTFIVDISRERKEDLSDFLVATNTSERQGVPTVFVSAQWIGSKIQQELDHLDFSFRGGDHHEKSLILVGLLVDAKTMSEENLKDFGVSCVDCSRHS